MSNKPPHYGWAREGLPYGGYNTLKGWSGEQFKEIVAHYYGLTTFIDDSIARVLQELDRLGLRDNCHVVFTSDHGEGLADHGIAAKPMMSYECVNRVPMLWRHPPSVKAEGVYSGVMSQVDLTPTFLDLAGAESLLGMEGRSFAAVLRGETDSHRDAVIVERISAFGIKGGAVSVISLKDPPKKEAPRTKRRQHAHPEVMRAKMLITEKWKLIHYGAAPYGELYDVGNDPEDLTNLWDHPDYQEVRRRLTERLLEELIESELGDPIPILERQKVAGALRDARLMESQPVARAGQ